MPNPRLVTLMMVFRKKKKDTAIICLFFLLSLKINFFLKERSFIVVISCMLSLVEFLSYCISPGRGGSFRGEKGGSCPHGGRLRGSVQICDFWRGR